MKRGQAAKACQSRKGNDLPPLTPRQARYLQDESGRLGKSEGGWGATSKTAQLPGRFYIPKAESAKPYPYWRHRPTDTPPRLLNTAQAPEATVICDPAKAGEGPAPS
jgi:hypothetical protein